MKSLLLLAIVLGIQCCYSFAEEEIARERRSVGYKQDDGYGQQDGYKQRSFGYEKKEYKKSKYPGLWRLQCLFQYFS